MRCEQVSDTSSNRRGLRETPETKFEGRTWFMRCLQQDQERDFDRAALGEQLGRVV